MKRLSLPLPLLAGVALLCGAVGFGLGRLGKGPAPEGAGERVHGEAAAFVTLEPPTVTGQSEAEKAARAEVRPFVPGRPFPKGGAEKWLSGLVPGAEGMVDMGGILASLRQLSTLDPEAAREVADVVVSILARLEADEEGDEAVALWEDSAEFLMVGLITSLGIVAAEDPEKALAVLDSMEVEEYSINAMVWTEIARHAPDRVEALLAGRDGDALRVALYGAVSGIFDSNPEAAMELLAKSPGDAEIWNESIRRMVELDPRRGVEWAADFVASGENTDALVSAISEWLEKDEAGARAWVGDYQGPGRDAARARLLLLEAREDPHGAMKEYAALHARGDAGEELRSVAGEIAGGLVGGDVAAARTWVEALPEGPEQAEAIKSLVSGWVREDATAASEWTAALPGGPARDSAAIAIAGAVAGSDPAAAFAWAHSLGDETMRGNLAGEILGIWIRQDPAAAYAAAAAQAAVRAETE